MRLDELTPPTDPRTSWDLPAFGQLPRVAALDELTTRILADNPSPMTLDGTNTYLLGAAGHGAVVLVDPGPDDAGHLARVEAAAADRDAEVAAVLVTHHHHDHAEAARPWARRFAVDVLAATREVAGPDGCLVEHGRTLTLAGLEIDVVATPGHTRDHLAFRLPTGALLSGDHVLGRGTSVVPHPEGDLLAYLDSLRRVRDLGPDALYPGHGPELTEDPAAVLAYYADHRAFREQQILAVLGEGPATPRQLVERIYAAVDPQLWPAAEASTRATLAALAGRGRIVHGEDDVVRLT
jgi:glyoxylase-like metal-dependent hydrolase (beta-lactamase superfamily II)